MTPRRSRRPTLLSSLSGPGLAALERIEAAGWKLVALAQNADESGRWRGTITRDQPSPGVSISLSGDDANRLVVELASHARGGTNVIPG